jgi:hypothetical protein
MPQARASDFLFIFFLFKFSSLPPSKGWRNALDVAPLSFWDTRSDLRLILYSYFRRSYTTFVEAEELGFFSKQDNPLMEPL